MSGMGYTADGEKIPVAREGELYSLKWHTFQAHLSSGLKQFLLDGEFLTDVLLVAEGQTIRSHRMLLSLCSPHFKQLFQQTAVPSSSAGGGTSTVVILNNVRYRDLYHVIQFIYNGEVKVSNNHELQGFLQTGELLQIEGLTKASQHETEQRSATSSQAPVPGPSAAAAAPATTSTSSSSSTATGGGGVAGPAGSLRRSGMGGKPATRSQVGGEGAVAAKRTRYSAATDAPTATPPAVEQSYETVTLGEDGSITADLSDNLAHHHQSDPLSITPGIEEGMMMGHEHDPSDGQELEDEQMITIDSIKSEGIYVHGGEDRTEDDEDTYDMSDVGDQSGMGDVSDMYSGAGVEELMGMSAGTSASGSSGAAVAGTSSATAKPPVLASFEYIEYLRGLAVKLQEDARCNRQLRDGSTCNGVFRIEKRNRRDFLYLRCKRCRSFRSPLSIQKAQLKALQEL